MYFVCASFSIMIENFKDRALIIPEISESIELHTYKFGLVYFNKKKYQISPMKQQKLPISFFPIIILWEY